MKAITDILNQGSLITEANKAVIFLHGRGGTADRIISLADSLCDSHCYVIAPQAKNNVWYPSSFMSEEKLNEPYLSASVKDVHELIEQTAQHIPKNQIFIVGFSQGACLALEVSARFAEKYGGIVAFTGGLIGSAIDKSKYHGDFEGTKILISNGDQDPYIPLIRSQQSKEVMESLGANVILKVYHGRPHIISEDEIQFVISNILHNE